jgi:hypothetical protein
VGDFEELLAQIRSGSAAPAAPMNSSVISSGGDTALRRAQDTASSYEKFLEALRKGKHPPFCELVWNGQAYHIVLLIHFQKAPPASQPIGSEADAFRRDAWSRFRKIGPVEQRLVSIRVTIKNWLPVTAELTICPEAAGVLRLGTGQLLDFQNP